MFESESSRTEIELNAFSGSPIIDICIPKEAEIIKFFELQITFETESLSQRIESEAFSGS
jgi:hypothetical protein